MKTKLIFIGIALVVIVAVLSAACTSVPPGHVGIVVNNYGSQRGVQDFTVKTGRVWYNPITENVYDYPTSMQTIVWTKSEHEGEKYDESITFNSAEGAVINCDISVSVSIDALKVPAIFVKFRQQPEDLIKGYIHSQVRNAFSEIASKYKVIDIFGEKKQEVLQAVQKTLTDKLGPEGFEIDNVSFVGALRVDQQVHDSILKAIQATQDAVRAENLVKQRQAEAEQAVAVAKGEADSSITLANGEAEALKIRAQAQANANAILAKSLTPQLVQYQMLEKWDGVLPQVTSGGTSAMFQLKGK